MLDRPRLGLPDGRRRGYGCRRGIAFDPAFQLPDKFIGKPQVIVVGGLFLSIQQLRLHILQLIQDFGPLGQVFPRLLRADLANRLVRGSRNPVLVAFKLRQPEQLVIGGAGGLVFDIQPRFVWIEFFGHDVRFQPAGSA